MSFSPAKTSTSYAQSATPVQNLDFGRLAITDFNVVGRLTINADGTTASTATIFSLDPPQRGEYTVSHTPDTDFTVTVSPASTIITGPTNPLTVDNFTVLPASPRTDALGNETVFIGARLSTAGGGLNHGNGAHTGTFNFVMNF